MKGLVAYLLIICLLLAALVFVVNHTDPPEPVLVIDAKAPAPKVGPFILALPPSALRPVWCLPAVKPPKDRISRA